MTEYPPDGIGRSHYFKQGFHTSLQQPSKELNYPSLALQACIATVPSNNAINRLPPRRLFAVEP